MTSIRKRRREILRLADGPARSWPWVRASRYSSGRRDAFVFGSISDFRFIISRPLEEAAA